MVRLHQLIEVVPHVGLDPAYEGALEESLGALERLGCSPGWIKTTVIPSEPNVAPHLRASLERVLIHKYMEVG